MGEDQVGKKGRAELGNGVTASVVAGKGAINPSGIPPMMAGVGGRDRTKLALKDEPSLAMALPSLW